MIGGSFSAERRVAERFPLWFALAPRSAWPRLRPVERLLVVKAGMQPIVATLILMVAGRGIAQLLTGGQIITVYYAPFFTLGNGFLLGMPWRCGSPPRCGRAAPAAVAQRARAVHPRHRRQSRGRARRRRALVGITLCVYTFCGSRPASPGSSSAPTSRAPTPTTPAAARARRHPRGDARRHRAHRRRFTLAGTVIGALIIQTLTSMIYSLGVPPEVNLVVKAALVFA
jgi:simple sugar transport system permease protein